MVKAYISNNNMLHTGNFGVNVVIDHPISDLSIDDFVFMDDTGNGMNGVILPDEIEIVYVGKSTYFMIPIELPDDVSGSFSVLLRNRMYTVDNTQYVSPQDAVDLPDTEQRSIECEEQIFYYRNIE